MARDKRNEQREEHFTKMVRNTMQTDAWRALSPVAQALYPWLKLEWRGPKANNNGKIRMSVRQAAEALGVNHKTAARGFHDLQAKGFLVQTEPARLGMGGIAKSPSYEITEIGLPYGDKPSGRKLYTQWQEGKDFNVHTARANNPTGRNGSEAAPGENVVKLGKSRGKARS